MASRYAWLIDYGEVEDAHIFKDPAKLESCFWFIYTTLPIPPRALKSASARELRWWLTVPAQVAEMINERAMAHSGSLTLEALPDVLRSACAAAGPFGKHVDVDEVMLRFASEAECDEYLREAEQMMDVLLPDRDLHLMAAQLQSCPSFVTKERLRVCWDQIVQIRGLLTQTYCRPQKADAHAYDSHPIQYAVALFHFALKMVTQYREPNPYSRRLAAHAIERLSVYVCSWLDGKEVERPLASNGASTNGIAEMHTHSFSYGAGQRLCFADGESWFEASVLRAPTAAQVAPTHLLRVYEGAQTREAEVSFGESPEPSILPRAFH